MPSGRGVGEGGAKAGGCHFWAGEANQAQKGGRIAEEAGCTLSSRPWGPYMKHLRLVLAKKHNWAGWGFTWGKGINVPLSQRDPQLLLNYASYFIDHSLPLHKQHLIEIDWAVNLWFTNSKSSLCSLYSPFHSLTKTFQFGENLALGTIISTCMQICTTYLE